MSRAALKLTVREIERLTGVNKDTISRYEAGREILSSALQKLEKLFRDQGIIFLEPDAFGGAGIRLPAAGKANAVKANSRKRSQKTP